MSQSPSAPSVKAPTSKLAVTALILSLFCFPVGLIVAIVAMIRIEGSKGTLGGKGLAIAALCVSGLMVPMSGCLAAIAIPNFVKFQCRSKQSEAKANLKALYFSEESFRADKNGYSTDLAALQFQPFGAKVRYEYVVVEADAEHFVAEARGVADGMAGDLWRITNKNDLMAVDDVCHR